MKSCLDEALGYTFYDMLPYIQAFIPNGVKKEATFSQAHYLSGMVEMLLNIEEGSTHTQDCVDKISTYHREYLKDIGGMTTICMLVMNTEIQDISNEAIRSKAQIFQKLPTYAKNPVEPLLKLLVRNSPYRIIIGTLIGSICRGDHVDVKLGIYDLEEQVKKGELHD